MPRRIPEEELARIKAEVSLERLAEAKGIKLRRHGADLIGLCPFHDDHEPSLVISPKKNLWHCLGACQAGGSVIDWVMRTESVSFIHAVELLRSDSFVASDPVVAGRTTTRVRRLPTPVKADAEDDEALRQVTEYYATTLRAVPEGMAYLEKRGLLDKEAIEHFQIGFANRTLGLRLPPRTSKAGGELRTRLQRLGIIRESGHEHFNGSVVMPITDSAGSVVEMYGRKVTSKNLLTAGTPLHLYLPGPHRGVWNAGGLTNHVVLCEALLDALTFWVHGLQSVTSSYGIEGFTEDHLAVFKARGVERVYIAYDRDAAGDKAAVQLAPKIVAAGIDVYRVQFPKDMDANAYACEELSTAGERLHAMVRRAVWLGKGSHEALSVAAPVPEPAKAEPVAPLPPTSVPDAVVQRDADARDETGQEEKASVEPVASPAHEEVLPVPAQAPEQLPVPAPPSPSPPPFAAPSAPSPEVATDGEDVLLTLGDRRYRVRGLGTVAGETLKVNVLLRGAGEGEFFVDTLDLYSAKHRAAYASQAASEAGVLEETVRRDLGKVILQLEQIIAERRKAEAAREREQTGVAALTEDERRAAMELLCDPQLLDHVVAAYDRIGVVGESTNKLVAYLAATSRLLEQPLAVVVQSSSAAGKSSLLEATLTLLPEQARVKYSAMTGQSLYYMAERELEHKVLAVVEEAGAERAAYALKLLQSEGELSIASTGKDPQTGRLVTHEYNVKGPVALFLTTTAIDIDEELLNRCLVLAVDEEREQTEAIHRRQRERDTLAGLINTHERQATIALHRAVQTLLRPLHVVNPYAPQLTFASSRTRTRRDHQKYLTLIRTIALMHQHQRESKRVRVGDGELEYIEVIPADIVTANRLAHEVLGRSLDELPPQTRRLLVMLDELVCGLMERRGLSRGEVRLTRKEIRDHTGWGTTQLAVHLARLTELEYVVTLGGGRGRAAVYELVWGGEGDESAPTLDGLIDPSNLSATYDAKLPGSGDELPEAVVELPGTSRPQNGGITGGYRPSANGDSASVQNGFLPLDADNGANHSDTGVEVAGEVVLVRDAMAAGR